MLFVCTGNVCRSPAAERLLRHRVPAGLDVDVRSAGLRALVGEPIDPPTARALAERGIDPSGHVATWYEDAMGQTVDLVLTAAQVHRDAVLRGTPRLLRRAFTIKEFVRLGAGLAATTAPASTAGADSLTDRVARIAAQRGATGPIEPGADDVRDPYGRGARAAHAAVAELADAVDGVVTILGW